LGHDLMPWPNSGENRPVRAANLMRLIVGPVLQAVGLTPIIMSGCGRSNGPGCFSCVKPPGAGV